LGEIDVLQQPLQLAEIYVPLDTTLRIPEKQTLAGWLARECTPRAEGALRPVSVLEALACPRQLTLLGKPRSGKSTVGARVLLTLAQAWTGHCNELQALGSEWRFGTLLPLRVELRRFAASLPVGETPARAGDLWEFIARDIKDRGYVTAPHTLQC